MQKCLSRACYHRKAHLKMNADRVYGAFNIDKKDKTIDIATKAMVNAGIKPKIELTGGGSDANIFNDMGIPSLIVGVGADRVHTRGERIAVDDLIKGAEMLLEIVKETYARNDRKK